MASTDWVSLSVGDLSRQSPTLGSLGRCDSAELWRCAVPTLFFHDRVSLEIAGNFADHAVEKIRSAMEVTDCVDPVRFRLSRRFIHSGTKLRSAHRSIGDARDGRHQDWRLSTVSC
jgi:hypothetical protein